MFDNPWVAVVVWILVCILIVAISALIVSMMEARRRQHAVSRIEDRDSIPVIPSSEATDPLTYSLMKALETGKTGVVSVDQRTGKWYDENGEEIEHG